MDNFFTEVTSARFLKIVSDSFGLEQQLCETHTGQLLYDQFFLAATSAGANYEDAWANESMSDFISKMQLVTVDLRKLQYYLKLILRANIIPQDSNEIASITNITTELIGITTKSIATARTKIDKRQSDRVENSFSIYR
ncbi:MAG: four helix bundle protein [Bacteroidales bacterium]